MLLDCRLATPQFCVMIEISAFGADHDTFVDLRDQRMLNGNHWLHWTRLKNTSKEIVRKRKCFHGAAFGRVLVGVLCCGTTGNFWRHRMLTAVRKINRLCCATDASEILLSSRAGL